jgi:hypothetical protein
MDSFCGVAELFEVTMSMATLSSPWAVDHDLPASDVIYTRDILKVIELTRDGWMAEQVRAQHLAADELWRVSKR